MIKGMIRLLNIEACVWCVCDITNNLHVLLRNTNNIKARECFAYDIIFRYYLKRQINIKRNKYIFKN